MFTFVQQINNYKKAGKIYTTPHCDVRRHCKKSATSIKKKNTVRTLANNTRKEYDSQIQKRDAMQAKASETGNKETEQIKYSNHAYPLKMGRIYAVKCLHVHKSIYRLKKQNQQFLMKYPFMIQTEHQKHLQLYKT